MKYVYVQKGLPASKLKIYWQKPDDGNEYHRKKLYAYEDEKVMGTEPDHEELKQHVREMFKERRPRNQIDDEKLNVQYDLFVDWHRENNWCRNEGRKKIPITNWKLRVKQWFANKIHLLVSYKKNTFENSKQAWL